MCVKEIQCTSPTSKHKNNLEVTFSHSCLGWTVLEPRSRGSVCVCVYGKNEGLEREGIKPGSHPVSLDT